MMHEDDVFKAVQMRAAARAMPGELFDVMREAMEFVSQHSEPWYFSGQRLCGRLEGTLDALKERRVTGKTKAFEAPYGVDPERGTGRTTRQMQAAPPGAVFVSAHHGTKGYDKELARSLRREDLLIVDPSWLTEQRWQGLTLPGIVIDHAAKLAKEEQRCLELALTRVRSPK
jgi:hypothetical protein